MAKQIIYGEHARRKLKAGVDALANAVSTTLGAKGGNVALEKSWGAPQVINDGVTIAKEIELEDKFENMGAQLVKEASSKTNDVAGDGTTTATVLAQALVREGLRNVAAGSNPMSLKRGIEKAVVVGQLHHLQISGLCQLGAPVADVDAPQTAHGVQQFFALGVPDVYVVRMGDHAGTLGGQTLRVGERVHVMRTVQRLHGGIQPRRMARHR